MESTTVYESLKDLPGLSSGKKKARTFLSTRFRNVELSEISAENICRVLNHQKARIQIKQKEAYATDISYICAMKNRGDIRLNVESNQFAYFNWETGRHEAPPQNTPLIPTNVENADENAMAATTPNHNASANNDMGVDESSTQDLPRFLLPNWEFDSTEYDEALLRKLPGIGSRGDGLGR